MILLVGCAEQSTSTRIPIDTVDIASQQGKASIYHCKDNKQVRVVFLLKKTKTTKVSHTIHVTFNNITERLVSTVSSKGAKYTNTYWQWQEKAGDSNLSTSTGVRLAEDCVRQ